MKLVSVASLLAALTLAAGMARAAMLDVGPGKPFARPEAALAKAQRGDEIRLWPQANQKPYDRVALLVRTPGLKIRGMADAGQPVTLDGAGFDYSGRGSIPRAIVQFDPGADGCTLENLELTGAHNESHNGAGIRINQANDVTIRHCRIHANDMGLMSNGLPKDQTGARQRIEACHIYQNGSDKDPGYNHNLYLGGTSVAVVGCEIDGALTGHNLKSRAHQNFIACNFIHDSANRELDLVDAAGATDIPESHTVLLGNVIVKKKAMDGNKTVIHFGQDGKHDHQGTLALVHNTIITPYSSPVIDLSAPGARALLVNNLIWNGGGTARQTLAAARAGAALDNLTAHHNWLSSTFALPPGVKPTDNTVAPPQTAPAFVDQAHGNYQLKAAPATGEAWEKIALPKMEIAEKVPFQQRTAAGELVPRPDAAAPAVGAAAVAK